ncbi:hypothetical protein [Marinicella gelatinilytica]|uniref:hypothetical protein n=1 Tax=Marinicella gelatinilytica TaxID=2996017 RepID=UPI0022608B27|nr:hypothetical protein [Marinicella gelatinilytica]MCX7544840.1 hypothetical protein [Marinicella gelatinilytica]
MSNINKVLNELMEIDGAKCASIVDYESGKMLAESCSGFNMELAAAGNTEVVRAKIITLDSLGLAEDIKDILITLNNQYHIINPPNQIAGIFLYLVLDIENSNLALARRRVDQLSNIIKT